MGNKSRKVPIEHDPIVRLFSARLRALRLERGMTQAELAERAGVTPTYLSRLEGAGAAPGIDLVARLAAAMGVATTELLPASAAEADIDVFREQARRLFDALLTTADKDTLALLNPFLALLAEASSKRD
jgi:transcriptional regulator with XRE-family HTH domain